MSGQGTFLTVSIALASSDYCVPLLGNLGVKASNCPGAIFTFMAVAVRMPNDCDGGATAASAERLSFQQKQYRQCTCNVKLWCVRVAILLMKAQQSVLCV
jgi:hypothetical protein